MFAQGDVRGVAEARQKQHGAARAAPIADLHLHAGVDPDMGVTERHKASGERA